MKTYTNEKGLIYGIDIECHEDFELDMNLKRKVLDYFIKYLMYTGQYRNSFILHFEDNLFFFSYGFGVHKLDKNGFINEIIMCQRDNHIYFNSKYSFDGFTKFDKMIRFVDPIVYDSLDNFR